MALIGERGLVLGARLASLVCRGRAIVRRAILACMLRPSPLTAVHAKLENTRRTTRLHAPSVVSACTVLQERQLVLPALLDHRQTH